MPDKRRTRKPKVDHDREREEWVLNFEPLYLFARAKGVNV